MPESNQRDLLGHPMTADERELLDLYRRLQALSARDDLPPCALMNARQAMVMLWNACTDLDLIFEEPERE
ncbi:MAG: hypothetical protein H6837_19375 [Planctomycetes bacterium]|nr:hypothetical protein [Planctomycetota bacterium]